MNRVPCTPYLFLSRCVDSVRGSARFCLASGFIALFLCLSHAGISDARNILIYPPGKQQTVTLACNPFPPSQIASKAALPGYDVEILRAAFASRNITLFTQFYPWRRAYFLARTGKVDGLCSCTYLREREDDFFYSYLLGHIRVAFYAVGNSALDKIEAIKDAKNMTVGVVNDYSLEASAREAGLDVLHVNNEATLLNMLLSRRLDVALSYEEPLDYQLHTADHEITEINKIRSKVISNNPYFSCISRNAKNPKTLLSELNTGLVTIRANGLYDKILAKYGIFKKDREPKQD